MGYLPLFHMIETDRLYLRPLVSSDTEALVSILCDGETMRFYPAPFTYQQVERWINKGLWAVILKENNAFIGDCGISMQDIEGVLMPELGYHINKQYWGKGYATEAAKAFISYAFQVLHYPLIVSYMKYDNLPSRRVAEKNGFVYVRSFEKIVMGERVKEVLYQMQNPIMPETRAE